jgi:hypothetical protein
MMRDTMGLDNVLGRAQFDDSGMRTILLPK